MHPPAEIHLYLKLEQARIRIHSGMLWQGFCQSISEMGELKHVFLVGVNSPGCSPRQRLQLCIRLVGR